MPRSFILCWRVFEKQFDVTVQVIQAIGCHLGPFFRFSEDEGSLDHGLDVESQAHRCKACDCIFLHRQGNVGDEGGGVATDALLARFANGRMGFVNFLNHGSDKAGEIRKVAAKDCLSKIYISEKPVKRVGVCMIRRGCEQTARYFVPAFGSCKCEILFADEVMEETTLGEAGCFTNILNAGGGVALGADHVESCIQQFGLGFVLCLGRSHLNTDQLV
jgi:hypothetical protein